MHRAHSNNTTGHPGVTWCPNRLKYRARIWFKGRQFHLGYFETVSDAAQTVSTYRARIAAKLARQGA